MEDGQYNLWHYTNLEGLMGILSNQALRATDYRFLNDSSEVMYSKTIVLSALLPRFTKIISEGYESDIKFKSVVDAKGGIEKAANQDASRMADLLYDGLLKSPKMRNIPYLLSFCQKPVSDADSQEQGLLSQWRGYGRDGGYAIIFNKKNLLEQFNLEEDSFYYGLADHGPASYGKGALAVGALKSHLDDVCDYAIQFFIASNSNSERPKTTPEYLGSLIRCMMLIKHPAFNEELEYRFHAFPLARGEMIDFPEFKESAGKEYKKVLTINKKGLVTPYINFFEKTSRLPIEKICVGPHREKELRVDSIKNYLHIIGAKHIEVLSSKIPYIG